MMISWDGKRDLIGGLRKGVARIAEQTGIQPTMINMSASRKNEFEAAMKRHQELIDTHDSLPKNAHFCRYKIERALGRKRWQALPLPRRVYKVFHTISRERMRINYNRRNRNEPDFEYWDRY